MKLNPGREARGLRRGLPLHGRRASVVRVLRKVATEKRGRDELSKSRVLTVRQCPDNLLRSIRCELPYDPLLNVSNNIGLMSEIINKNCTSVRLSCSWVDLWGRK